MPLPRQKISRGRKRRPKATGWVELEWRLEELEGTWCEGDVLNLPGWQALKYRETGDDVIVLAELTTEIAESCACGAGEGKVSKWGYTEINYVRDVPVRGKRTRIYYRLQRKRCVRCKKTFQQPLLGVNKSREMTNRLVEHVARESFSIFRTFTSVANEAGCTEICVRNIFTSRARALEEERVIETPRWLAIDEVHPKERKIVHCVITDPERRRVLDLLPTNDQTRLSTWLIRFRKETGLEIITIDMWDAYKAAVRSVLPDVRIVVDRYHVHNLLSVALKGVLAVVRDSMTRAEQRKYMCPEYLLLKNFRKLSAKREKDEESNEYFSELETVKQWLADVPDLATPYLLNKDFSDILQLTDRQEAEARADTWLERAIEFVRHLRAKYKKKFVGAWEDPYGNVPNTITKWRAEILNYVEFKDRFGLRPTNAFAEFANKQIKKGFNLGNGYDYEVLRAKVLHGGVLVAKRPAHPLDEKHGRAKWDRARRERVKDRRRLNPESNLALLKKAREDKDEIRNLFTKPEEVEGWSTRFGPFHRGKGGSATGKKTPGRIRKVEDAGKEDGGREHRPFRHNSDQLKMF